MKIISFEQKMQWNEIVKSFPNWDIYYLNEYAHSLWLHGDGIPYLIYIAHDGSRMAYVVMQSDISEFLPFQQAMKKGMLYDWSTPYGYGGPLLDGETDREWMDMAEKEIDEYAKKHHIVSEFFRYHPLLQNQKMSVSTSRAVYLKKTVYIDTSSKEIIQENMAPNARNMIRKAEKNGVEIMIDHGERMEEFMEIYYKTMQYRGVDRYYYFEFPYFEDIRKSMKEHIIFFYGMYQKKIISASIFFYNNNFMHYHLSGTLPEYRKLASANLVLAEAALWACSHGIKQFHLGGGIDDEDSLLRFKKHFNRRGLIDFYIGRKIFMQEEFDKLVQLRKELDENFDEQRKYLILYRG